LLKIESIVDSARKYLETCIFSPSGSAVLPFGRRSKSWRLKGS